MKKRRNYSIKRNRYSNSFMSGFTIEGNNRIVLDENSFMHCLILGRIDGVEEDANWGQLHFDCDVEEEMIYTVYVFSYNYENFNRKGVVTSIDEFLRDDTVDIATKKEFFEIAGAKKIVNHNDILLYDIKGRYLYVMLEINGIGKGSIENMYINSQGDFFMDSLPEVYHEYGGFYHRYLSIFSTMFMELQGKIENADSVLDLDNASYEALTLFGKWLGIDVSGDFLSEDKLRKLVKEAYSLNRMKGTKKALERLTEIILDEKTIILEKNCLHNEAESEDNYEALYGKGAYDVTMLIKTYVPENQKSQLLFLIKQFVPVRCNLNIRFMDESSGLDDHLYLDMNTKVNENVTAELDVRHAMDGRVLLE